MIYDHLGQPIIICPTPLVYNPVKKKCTTAQEAAADAGNAIPALDPSVVLHPTPTPAPAPSSSGGGGAGWLTAATIVGIGILVWSAG